MQWLPVILILPYLFLLLKLYRSLLIIKPFHSSSNSSAYVSVVVACKNEEERLPCLLNCLSRQNYPGNLFEIIIIDDNSTDRTFEIAEGFSRQGNIITIHNNGKGKKQALRTGINASSGSLIITTDADCSMGNNWIRTIAAYYENYRPEMIICPVQIESAGGFFGRFQELEFLGLQGITAGSAISNSPTMCNGANLAFTKSAYLANIENIRFEIPSGDDVFLLHSLKNNKKSKIMWLESSDAMVTTASSPTVGSFLRQRRRWLSKGKTYKDPYTISLGIITFAAILIQLSVLASVFFVPELFLLSLAAFVLKAVPDYLILQNTAKRYFKGNLLAWFFPSQIVYPFYIICVSIYSIITIKRP